ncbi:DUF4129 domain-containing protein [Nostoc sp. TCL26-01]|uniref:DUF4129 domain-containing protein n=1 Tax=Nostoc sp. TCL26-01 TaxID=2576904 RepID=UPI0015BA4AE7|nr:DUF4129 domain-containing protein [Nostoc sp. TCL26-01]QLE56842.1 DUF4129 domain-containing protein [Nostoc sp. TCL26-01]
MSTDSFENSSWSWQFSQLQQQVGEWLEYQSYRLEKVLPDLPPLGKISPWLANLLHLLAWVLLGLFLAIVIWRLWVVFSPYIYSWLAGNGNFPSYRTKTLAEDLTVTRWLERSQELYRQGNYREACRCLYLAILQHLHDTKTILHKSSRTDAEYLQLLQSSTTPIQPYETVMTIHEQLCFSDGEILPENYQQCRQAYQEIVQK